MKKVDDTKADRVQGAAVAVGATRADELEARTAMDMDMGEDMLLGSTRSCSLDGPRPQLCSAGLAVGISQRKSRLVSRL